MRMKVLFASLLLAASGQVLAQSSGQIGGQVFDENGKAPQDAFQIIPLA